MSELSVIIAAYQAEATLAQTLRSLRDCENGEQAQVIVVDDGSSDNTAAVAEQAGVVVLRRPHQGRAAALNAGLAAAQGKWIFFIDADCLAPATWYRDTLAHLGDYDGLGGNLHPSAFTAVELAKVLRYVEEFERDIILKNAYDGVCLNGNNMMIRREALATVGGFDEGYVHGADADLTRRLLAAGYHLLRTTKTHTVHLKIDTLRSFLRTMWRRGSTVRFGMDSGAENALTLTRALLLSPLKWLAVDLMRVPRLRVFGKQVDPLRAWLAPWINLLGGWATGLGRIHFYRRFRRERS
ncbi:MAG TPA: glycosyltransferase family 2 protein [bacterium]|nr:glycosyltransferase family 2 protein [bacterium]